MQQNVPQDYIKKLAESGLSTEYAEKLGITYIGSAALYDKQFSCAPAMKIPYYDIDTNPLSDKEGHPQFYRLRYLHEKNPTGFAAKTKKAMRYTQPSDTLPVAYFPKLVYTRIRERDGTSHLVKTTWRQRIDKNEAVIITEGELKAAKACKEGFPTIGLGGVTAWRALKKGVHLLKCLEDIEWHDRRVYICFDSDYKTNRQVCASLNNLAHALDERGAYVYLITLRQLEEGKKTGLDDFFVINGPQAPEIFLHLLQIADPLGIAKTLFSFNKRYLVVEYPICVYDKRTRREIPPEKFKTVIEADAKYAQHVLTSSGSIKYEYISAAKKWMEWPLRDRVNEIAYEPGEAERLTVKESGHEITQYNVWPGWGTTPADGSIRPFLDLVDHLFSRTKADAKEWFLDWLAYPLQYPGTKMYTSVVIYSTKHGVGKTLVGYTMAEIYGDNFAEITQRDLKRDFTGWAVNRQFILGDDVTGSDQRQFADMLKTLITQKKMTINKKNIPIYEIKDCINYLFTSNHPDAFYLEDTDRRFFIVNAPNECLPLTFYTEVYDPWLHSKQGPAALFSWLLARDTKSFKPQAPAPQTIAKKTMIAAGRSDLANWVREMLEDPTHYLPGYQYDLITAHEALKFYDPEGKTRVTMVGMSRELQRAGAHTVLQGERVRVKGCRYVYYVVRNLNEWIGVTAEEVRDHILKSEGRKY